jgi:predicted GNAT family acetyltransferase
MNIQHKETDRGGSFYMSEGDEVRGEIVYAKSGDSIIIEHTEVDEALRGKDFGYDLVEQVVSYARQNELKVVPVCRFAKAVFDKKKDYSDVLA